MEILNMEDLQAEKERLRRKTDHAREAFLEKAKPSSWIKSAGFSLGGLLLTGAIAFALRRLLFSSQDRARPGKPRKVQEEGIQPAAAVGSTAAFAILMPILRRGVSLMLDAVEDRVRKGKEE